MSWLDIGEGLGGGVLVAAALLLLLDPGLLRAWLSRQRAGGREQL